MFKKTTIVALFILSFISVSYSQDNIYKKTQEKIYKKMNVKKEDAREAVGKAIFSIGFSSPALGNDPCQGVEKTMGGMKKYGSGGISLGKLPGKPSVSIGKQGQIMEGETSQESVESYSAENVCYEGYDAQGNKCVEATANPDGTTTFKNESDESCIIQLGDKHTLSLAPHSEITTNTQREENNPILEGLGKVRSWIIDKIPDWMEPEPSSHRTSAVGVRGNCDPEGIAGGCRINAGSGVVLPTLPEYLTFMAKAEKEGFAKRLRWTRINPSPESAGTSEGPKPSVGTTHPGQSTKSGYEKEKGSKVDKGGTITNPSEPSSGKAGGRGLDFCGRHLPTPQEAASMGFDPGRITDPANRDWTGRIEQRGTERTLTWSKTVSGKENVRVEYTYKDGGLVAINYEFFDKKGNKIGLASYDAKTGTVEAKRLK